VISLSVNVWVLGTLVGLPIVAVDQREIPLRDLTVPKASLPAGCRLAPVPKTPSGENKVFASPGLRENPWMGSDPAKGAVIRGILDGYDAEPQTPESMKRSGAGVREAYRAVYLAADGSRVDVYAVHFADSSLTVTSSMQRLKGRPLPIVHGALAVLVLSGRPGECSRAVFDHISSLR